MRRFTTILCSIAFMIAGFIISFMKPPELQNQLHAAPVAPIVLSRGALPLDLQLDLAKHDSIQIRKDTIVLHDTVQVVKYKIKYRAPKKKVAEPDSLPAPAKPDTLSVPKLKILIQMSEDVLMDTTFTVVPDSVECPQIQPLRACEE